MIRAPRDFGSGLLFLLFAAAAVAIASGYPIGTSSRMGPGYFPLLLAGALGAIGTACIVRSFVRDGEPIGALAWVPLAKVIGGTLLFGGLLRGAGAPLAIGALVLLSASASQHFRWPRALGLAAALALFSALLFSRALGLPLPLLGNWLGGQGG